MEKVTLFCIGLLFLSLGNVNAADIKVEIKADIKAGEQKAKICAGCHGVKGISSNNLWPNLAGQKKGYLIKQLKDFKSGVRKDTQMQYWAKSLSNQEIENLAAFFSNLK